MAVDSPRQPLDIILQRLTSSAWFKVVAVILIGAAAYVVTCLPFLRLDLEIYRFGGHAWLDGADLYGELPETYRGFSMPFTYPPIAAILFAPLNLLPLIPATMVFNLVALSALLVIMVAVVRRLTTLGTAQSIWVGLACTGIATFTGPLLHGFTLGQINILLMLLVFADAFVVPRKYKGWLTGLAISIKLTPAVFGLYWLVKRDWRAIISMGVSTLLFTGLGFVLSWKNSVAYWFSVLWDPSRIGGQAYVSNQSITGELFRLGIMDSTGKGKTVWLILVLALLAYVTFLVVRLVRDHHDLLALATVNVFGLLASPVSWDHHWAWIPLILITLFLHGRSGEASGKEVDERTVRTRWSISWTRVGLVGLGFVCFVLAPTSLPIPQENDLELSWPWYMHIIGNAFLVWSVAFLAAMWWLSPRMKQANEQFC